MRWIVLRSEIFRRGFVRIRLALVVHMVAMLRMSFFGVFAGGVNFFHVGANIVIFRVGMTAFVRAYDRR